MRPLRTINKIRGISDLVNALLYSIPSLMNVMLFLIFIIILLATFGLHLYSGMYEYRCRIGSKPVNNSWPLYPNYYSLCNTDLNNCPGNSTCGAPF